MSVEMSAEMAAPLGSTASEEEHEEHRQHLMLDPRPQEEMNRMVIDAMQRTGLGFWFVVGVLALLAGGGLVGAWVYQIRWGMGVAAINRPNYWGVYIVNFVFWVGISHSGTFVSAILRVFKAEFRRPITRAAEMMTTVSLLVAVAFLGIHVGRTWRGYWIAPYPNQRGLWPNFHSPFLFDEFAIASYLVGSTLYLFLPLIPDLGMAWQYTTGWRSKLYRVLSLGWKGTESQWRNLQMGINIFAIVIIPIMFSVHTIVAWDFALTKVVGWHSSIFGPYFVVGAIFSGVAAVTNVLFIARSTMKLEYFIRPEHFDALAKLILVFSFVWTYFFFTDFFVEWYGGDATGHTITAIQTTGPMAPFFYLMLFCNILVPCATLWSKKVRRSPVLLFLVALVINVGMYVERFIIVTGFLRRNDLPFNWGSYTPSWVEISISIGSLATFLLLYALLSRLFPIIPVWEVREGQLAHTLRRFGKALIPSIAELEE
jgi:molybdopterin-containing oxidoreductase family membrane subunit